MGRLDVTPTPLAGLMRVRRHARGDERGALTRLFCADELREAGWARPIAQINHTLTHRTGTVRGLHYQRPPSAEAKLVSCLRGAVFDVAVDLRTSSPTFLRWHAERLSADNGLALLIPEGFAHGFQALTDEVELLYCHSAVHAPDAEAGLAVEDPRLAIHWPLPVANLSARDAAWPPIDTGFTRMHP